MVSSTRKLIVNGPPTIATASVPMPASMQAVGSRPYSGRKRVKASPNSLPVSAPMNREEKNSPPRKPEPRLTRAASILSAISPASTFMGRVRLRSEASAPWPAASTCGLTMARHPTISPPSAGVAQGGRRVARNSRSLSSTPRMATTPTPVEISPSPRITR